MTNTMVENKHNIKVGDYFVCSWGWEQTNIDFYKVVGLTPRGIKLQKWTSRQVSSNGFSDQMVPGDGPEMVSSCSPEGQYLGLVPARPQQRKLQSYEMGSEIRVYVTLNSYSSAAPWDGEARHQTGFGYGH